MSASVSVGLASAYKDLRQLRPIVSALLVKAKKTVLQCPDICLHARLDYGNPLLRGTETAVPTSVIKEKTLTSMLPALVQ